MALVGVHGLKGDAAAVLLHLAGHLAGQTLQTLLPLGAVVLRVHLHADALVRAGVDGVVGQLLDGVQRLAAMADELTQLLAYQQHLIAALLHLVDLHLGGAVHVLQQAGHEGDDALGVVVIALRQVHLGRGGSGGLRALLRLGTLLAGLLLTGLPGLGGLGLNDLLRRLFRGLLRDDAGGGHGFFRHGGVLRAIGDANTGGGRADA